VLRYLTFSATHSSCKYCSPSLSCLSWKGYNLIPHCFSDHPQSSQLIFSQTSYSSCSTMTAYSRLGEIQGDSPCRILRNRTGFHIGWRWRRLAQCTRSRAVLLFASPGRIHSESTCSFIRPTVSPLSNMLELSDTTQHRNLRLKSTHSLINTVDVQLASTYTVIYLRLE
jgi:hypothetical protein